MFERFTERARQVVVLAQEEARASKVGYIGTEHVLLGLTREEEGIAARVLLSLGITTEKVRDQIKRIVGESDEPEHEGQIPFTPRAKKILELALREALSLGHSYIGTEHILLGLIRENEGIGMRILLDHGCATEQIREEVMKMLTGPGGRRVREKKPEPEPRWVVSYDLHDKSYADKGGWERKPQREDLAGVIRFFDPAIDSDEPEVFVPIAGLKLLKVHKEDK